MHRNGARSNVGPPAGDAPTGCIVDCTNTMQPACSDNVRRGGIYSAWNDDRWGKDEDRGSKRSTHCFVNIVWRYLAREAEIFRPIFIRAILICISVCLCVSWALTRSVSNLLVSRATFPFYGYRAMHHSRYAIWCFHYLLLSKLHSIRSLQMKRFCQVKFLILCQFKSFFLKITLIKLWLVTFGIRYALLSVTRWGYNYFSRPSLVDISSHHNDSLFSLLK